MSKGRHMKKFLVISLILLVIAAVIFYFGWIQLKVEKDTYGVIYTKTGGYMDKPVTSNAFRWAPAALIPYNTELISIPSSSRTISITGRQPLPSSAEYSSVMVGNADFSYEAVILVSYRLSTGYVTTLVEDRGYTSENIGEWYSLMEDALTQAVLTEIQGMIGEQIAREHTVDTIDEKRIKAILTTKFPELAITDFSLISISLPDLELYEMAKGYYRELVAVKNSSLQEELIQTADQRAQNEVKIDLLKRYGSLFSEFPALIDYIKADPELKSLD